jgi:tetratricopeptide (TPR) repeat protein
MAVYDLNDGKLHQAGEYLCESLAILQESGDKFWQSQVLELMGELASRNQEFKHAISYFESALTLSREIGDLDGIAWHLYKIARTKMEQTSALDLEIIEYARVLAVESLKTFLKGENIPTASLPMLLLGDLDWRQGNYHRASIYFNKALSHGETNGELRTVNFSLTRLASLALSQGEYQQAGDLFNQKMKINLKWNHTLYIAESILDLGDLEWVMGEYEQAICKYKTALEMFRKNNWKHWETISLFCLGRISLLQGEFRLARGYLDEAIKMSNKFAMNDWENRIVEVFAILASSDNEPKRSARLFGATAAWHASWPLTRWIKERQEREQAVSKVRSNLGEEAFNSAWEKGQAMTPEQAMGYALRTLDS